MGYQLIIAEKPTAAEKIASALAEGPISRKIISGVQYYELKRENTTIVVAATVGHIFSLAEKNKGKWTYPVFDLEWKPSYLVSRSSAFTKKYFDALKKIASGATSFVNGCDFDTEGELIFRNILNFIYGKKDASRMRFSTLTKDDLIKSYETAPKHIDFALAEAGETRHHLDFLWGVNTSRALTLAVKAAGSFKILSSGRVQSPILALLVEREKEIEGFIPKPFWQLEATISAKKADIIASHETEKFWKENEAKNIFEKCDGKKAIVKDVKKRSYAVQAPAPFSLTSLQTEAYAQFGFSPAQTLQIAESLYLAAFISYPRTSSEKLPAEIGWKQILQALAKIKEFSKNSTELLSKKKLKPNEGKKTDSAHVAIYPTSSPPKNLAELSEHQRKVYELIVGRFLATFGDAAKRESMQISFDIAGERFIASGARTISSGWMSSYEKFVKVKEALLPELKIGETCPLKNIELKKDETKPPNRYSQGSIIAEMEKRNLGTKATRAEILQTLYDRNYITGKQIQVTELGKHITLVLKKYVPDLISEKLTRHFEAEMELIQVEKKEKVEVLDEAKKILVKILKKFKVKEKEIGKELIKAVAETRRAESIIGTCPACKADLKIIRSKKSGKIFVGCSGYSKGCRTAFPLPQMGKVVPTKQLCKSCNSPIVLVYTKGRRPWILCINHNCPAKKEKKAMNEEKNENASNKETVNENAKENVETEQNNQSNSEASKSE